MGCSMAIWELMSCLSTKIAIKIKSIGSNYEW